MDRDIYVIDDDFSLNDLLKTISSSVLTTVNSFYILDVQNLVNQHFTFTRLMPRVKPFYAIKCNSNQQILSVLASVGTNFDCASIAEIKTILSLGVSSDRIIFANPTKIISHIQFAAEKKVNLTVFDHENELIKIKKYHPNAKLLLRIRSDSKYVTISFGDKFGCDVDRDASRILQVAKDMDLNVVGVCFHVGSNCQEPEAYYQALAKAHQVFVCAKKIGYTLNMIDIGGGFPHEKTVTIDQIADAVNSGLDEFFSREENLEIIAEPGRYYVSPVLTLACRVCSHKENLENNSFIYYISDGVFGSFMGLAFQDMDPPTPFILQNYDKRQLYPSTIWGPTCDSVDLIVSNCLLPKLNLNNWMFFDNMGAYTLSLKTNFNNFPLPPIIAFVNQKTKKLLLNNNFPKDILKENGIRNIINALNNFTNEYIWG